MDIIVYLRYWYSIKFAVTLKVRNANIFMLGIVKTKQLILGFEIGLWVTKGHLFNWFDYYAYHTWARIKHDTAIQMP
mgnify:CR=1 FL=1